MKTTPLIERMDFTEAVIDTAARTARQIIIRAGWSSNRRLYSPEVLERAIPLFEGAQTYADHPTPDEIKDRRGRSVLAITGYLSEVKFEDNALKATRHFVGDAGEKVWKLVEHVLNGSNPSLIGASINAFGKARVEKRDDQDVYIVEAIDGVWSVDDVSVAAAGGGFELRAGENYLTRLLQSMEYQEWFDCRPDYTARLQNEMKMPRQDSALKAAKAEAEALSARLQETQAENERLREAHEAASADQALARRALLLEQALRKAQLPILWEEDLRSRLMNAPIGEWDTILKAEQAKARRIAPPKVSVHGAGQQVADSLPTGRMDIYPADGEDVTAWMRRIRLLRKE